jgi:hypothetical protein
LVSTNLTYLKLTDFHDFTVQALKDMVTAGAMGWRKDSRMAGWKTKRRNSLEVSACGSPLLDKDKNQGSVHGSCEEHFLGRCDILFTLLIPISDPLSFIRLAATP